MKIFKWEIYFEKEWIMIHGYGSMPDMILKRTLKVRRIK